MKLKITKEKFEELYNRLSNQELAQRLKISVYFVQQAAKELGLSKRAKGRPLRRDYD